MPTTSRIVGTTSTVRALFLLLLVPTLSADFLVNDFLRCAMTFFSMISEFRSIILETRRQENDDLRAHRFSLSPALWPKKVSFKPSNDALYANSQRKIKNFRWSERGFPRKGFA